MAANTKTIKGPRMRAKEFVTESRRIIKEGARIAHAEDLVFYEGSAGALRAVANIAGLMKTRDTLSIKWDGRPALVFGRDENGTFIMTDKSGFGAKGYNGRVTSPEELKAMMVKRPGDPEARMGYIGMLTQLWPMVEAAVPTGYRGFILGDLMYSDTPPLNDKGRLEFTPNTVTYEVDPNSDLGQRIVRSKAGMAVHTFIPNVGAEGQPLTDTAGLNLTGPLCILGPEIKNEAPVQQDKAKIKYIQQQIKANAKAMDTFLDPATLSAAKMTGLPDTLYTYVNQRTRTQDLSHLFEGFLPWVQSNPKISKPMVAKVTEYCAANAAGLKAIFGAFELITDLKHDVIRQLDSHNGPVQAHIAGKPGGEGYVNTDPGGNIKYVNRLGFSAANFAGNA